MSICLLSNHVTVANYGIIIFGLNSNFWFVLSVPTPAITDALNVAWTPQAPNKNSLLRIGNKLKLEDNYKQDIMK